MIKENRVLAYEKATELKDSDLITISGGSAKMSVKSVTSATGYYPGPVDVEVVQIWD